MWRDVARCGERSAALSEVEVPSQAERYPACNELAKLSATEGWKHPELKPTSIFNYPAARAEPRASEGKNLSCVPCFPIGAQGGAIKKAQHLSVLSFLL